MAKYKIEIGQIGKDSGFEDGVISLHIKGMGSRYIRWQLHLGAAIAGVFDCRTIVRKKHDMKWDDANGRVDTAPTGWDTEFIGFKDDVIMAVHFYIYLRRTIGRKTETDPRAGRNKKAFAMGMIAALRNRLELMFTVADEQLPAETKDLMVVKVNQVEKFMEKEYPRLRNMTDKSALDPNAYHAGRAVGKSVPLGKPIANNGAPKRQIN
jgi:hypothetical protein